MNQGYTYREQIEVEGVTALEYLTARYPHSSRAEWRVRLESGEVSVGDGTAGVETALHCGDWLVWRRPPWTEEDVPLTFTVLYEDEDLLAVDKPGGLPTVPAGGFLNHTLLTLVQRRTPEATPMHRLGRGTTGIVLFAKSALARSVLQAAWRRHEVAKVYRTLVSGQPPPAFVVTTPIGPVEHAVLRRVFAASETGKPSTSRVTLVEQREEDALVDVAIDTGRPHQIRIHLAAAGHPLVGDPLYVAGGCPAPGSTALPGDSGYLLHAASLTFRHPRTSNAVVVACTPPPSLQPLHGAPTPSPD